MSELKACPFCGSDQVGDHLPGYVSFGCCNDANCSLTQRFPTQVWNTRPIEDALRAENEELRSRLDGLPTGELKELGSILADLLDSDDFNNVEPYLSGAHAENEQLKARVAELENGIAFSAAIKTGVRLAARAETAEREVAELREAVRWYDGMGTADQPEFPPASEKPRYRFRSVAREFFAAVVRALAEGAESGS